MITKDNRILFVGDFFAPANKEEQLAVYEYCKKAGLLLHEASQGESSLTIAPVYREFQEGQRIFVSKRGIYISRPGENQLRSDGEGFSFVRFMSGLVQLEAATNGKDHVSIPMRSEEDAPDPVFVDPLPWMPEEAPKKKSPEEAFATPRDTAEMFDSLLGRLKDLQETCYSSLMDKETRIRRVEQKHWTGELHSRDIAELKDRMKVVEQSMATMLDANMNMLERIAKIEQPK